MIDDIAWWQSLSGDSIDINTAGVPPYGLDYAAARIVGRHRPRRALDIGCGVGRLTERLASEITLIDAFDIAPQMIMRAERNTSLGVRYRIGDGRHIPFQGDHYDLIYSVTVFQHLPQGVMRDYIVQAIERLASGGRLVFTVSVNAPVGPRNHPMTPDDFFDFQRWLTHQDLFSVTLSPPDHLDWIWIEATK